LTLPEAAVILRAGRAEEDEMAARARVGINGFGRIGRCALRAGLSESALEFVAVNDLTDAKTLGHLLKYDSVHGRLAERVEVADKSIRIGDRELKVIAERDPAKLPWKELGVDIVIESTGLFTKRADAAKHLSAGAKKVIISAPATEPDVTIALGVNEQVYQPGSHHVISNASCTTNCLAPVAKILHQEFGVRRGWMTTIHAYTNDQQILDLPHSDLRRARAAAVSMIPTSTGAAKAVGLVLPELAGKLDGISIRVPTPDVSVVDLVAELDRPASVEQINEAFKKAAEGPMKGILAISYEPLVSIDFLDDPHSAIVDAQNTKVLGGNLVKVLAWYDNEWGYARRVVDLARMVAAKL
jgi:glyceraldehyde 3-phosphate dehydrogenase